MTSPIGAPPQPAKKPGAAGFWIGGLLIAAGIVAGIVGVVVGVQGFSDTVNGYQRVSLASGGTVELGTGTYRVFYEAPGADETFGPRPSGYTITAPDGQPVTVGFDSVSETYSLNGRDGRKVGKFSAPAAGTYEVRTTRSDGSAGSGTAGTLAFGRKGPTSSIAPILIGVFGGLALGLVGVIVLIVTGVRRGRAKRTGGYPGGPPPGGYGAPAWGAPPTGPGGWAPPPSGPAGAPGWAPPSSPPPGSWSPPPGGPVS